MKPTLLILAAGMGNRYGGLKQVDPMGPSGETLMEYGIYDAISAGFKKAVFLFRDNIVSAFEKSYKKLEDHIELEYAFQDVNPQVSTNNGKLINYVQREKPWGTAHAILSAASAINEPFAVINADDFYGPSAYHVMSDYLKSVDTSRQQYAIVGYPIDKTLSPHGTVSRAVLEVNGQSNLRQVVERTKIKEVDGEIKNYDNQQEMTIARGTLVSTNFWGFTPAIFDELQSQFSAFVAENGENPKSEFYIPFAVNSLVESQAASVEVLTCSDNWMGVTYKEDKVSVMDQINSYISRGIYPNNLWS
ncbi:MAG: nucleotidyltransferase [Cyclobacteriaceae bacterium]|nr:MAG: nucleotidyltransferase [Cyclobacteriaceae bacterium]